jgi:hypothetical protein
MKKTLTIIGLLATVAGVHAQGTINYGDYVQASSADPGGFEISVLSPNSTDTAESGNTSSDAPSGSTVYTGSVFIGGTATGTGPTSYYNGNNYTVGVYVATTQAGLTADVLTGSPLATATFNTTYGAGNAGVWGGDLVATDNSIAPGTAVYVELAAWYSGGGATSYAAAVAAGDPAGESVISTSEAVLGGSNGGVPVTQPSLYGLGLTSFDMTTVPEPSTIALGVMGASAFLFRRRNK